MSDAQNIRVVISATAAELRSALKGAQGDLGDLALKIKEVPNEVKIDVKAQVAQATARLKELRDLAKDVPDRIKIEASADTGVASAKLRLLAAQARDAEEAIARAQLGSLLSGGGGGGGGGSANLLAGLTAGPGPGWLTGIITLAPLAAGALGSLGAVVGSLGAAMLGAGAVMTSFLGVLGVGFGSIAAVAVPAVKGISSVSKAMTALEKAQSSYPGQAAAVTSAQTSLNTATAKYGANSKQAQAAQATLTAATAKYGNVTPQVATAQKNLNTAIAQAGPGASQIAKQLSAISDQWNKLSQPAVKALDLSVIVPALKVVSDLMPTVAAIAKTSLDAIGAALKPIFQGLSSPAFKKVLTDLGNAFARLAGPMIASGANLMRAFLNVAVAASPYLIQIAQAFERWSKSFADSLSPGQHLSDMIGGLVGQLHSWWNLAVAIGHLMVTIFSAGASTGKQLVDQLTALLTRWNAWLNTSAGQEAIKKFFTDSANLLRGVLTALAPVAKLIGALSVGLIPVMTTLLAPLASILATISGWVNDLSKSLPPVLSALPGLAVAVGVLASWNALKAVVASTTALMTKRITGAGASAVAGAPVVAGAPAAGKLGIGTKILGGLGIAALGTIISDEIGAAIKGGVGRAVKDIGTGASIGGGLGSLFGPWGAAVGAALGGAIGGAVDLFVSHGPSEGEKWAQGFAASLPGHISKAVKKGLAQGVDSAPVTPGSPTVTPGMGISRGATSRPGFSANAPGSPGFAAQVEAAVAWARAQGAKAGHAWIQGMQSVKVPSGFGMTRDALATLQDVPLKVRAEGAKAVTAWREIAAKQMLAYATTLEQQGKLPKGAVDSMIKSLEGQFPGLKDYLDRAALSSFAAWAQNANMTSTLSNLKTALGNVRSQFDVSEVATKITATNIFDQAAIAMNGLQIRMLSATASNRVKLLAEYNLIKSGVNTIFQSMTGQTVANMHKLSGAIAAGSSAAARAAGKNMADLEKSIFSAMSAGVLSASSGANLITKAVNAELKAFGAKQIPIGVIAATVPSNAPVFVGGGHSGTFAQGGLTQIGRPGAKGRDAIPLSVGGQGIVVGAGEQVAVLNDQQQAELNRRTADVGGLPGFFNRFNRPHYMSGGGFVPRFGTGGPVGGATGPPGNVVDLHSGDMTQGQEPQILADLYKLSAELAQTVYIISGYRTPAHSVAVGGFANDPHTRGEAADIGVGSALRDSMFGVQESQLRAVGLYRPFYPPSAAEVNHVQLLSGGASGSLTPGFAGAAAAALAWKAIQAPKVRGKGTLADMARAFLGKETGAANAYGQKQVSKLNAANAASVGAVPGNISGSVSAQIAHAAAALGFDKLAIAGIIGNAEQESSLNPSMSVPGNKGLFSWTPANSGWGSVVLGNVAQQVALAASELTGGASGMNAASTSPTAAAEYWNANFEHAGIYGSRDQYAAQAYAAGFGRGGLLRQFARGGLASWDGTISTYGPGTSDGPYSGTASGIPATHAAVSLKSPGSYWDDPVNHALMRHWFALTFRGKTAEVQDIDLGPSAPPNIDFTGALDRMWGLDPGSFPTGATAHIQELPQGGHHWTHWLKGAGAHHHHKKHHHHHPGGPGRQDLTDSKTGRKIPGQFLKEHGGGLNQQLGGHGSGRRDSIRPPLHVHRHHPEPLDLQHIHKRMELLGQRLGQGSKSKNSTTYLGELLNYWQGIWPIKDPAAWAIASDPSAAVITTDPKTGNAVAPYLDKPGVAKATEMLRKQILWESQIVADLKDSVPVAASTEGMVRKAIERRRDEIAKKAKRVGENLKRIKELERRIQANKKLISKHLGSGAHQGLGKTKPDTAKILAWQAQNKAWTHQIGDLSRENIELTGSGSGGGITPQGHGGQSVTGGQIGRIAKQIPPLQSDLSQVANPSGSYSPDQLQGLTGHGGALGSEEVTLRGLRSQLGALDPGKLADVLREARQQSSASRDQALAQLQATEIKNLQTDFLTAESQLGVLKGFAPLLAGRLVGSFQSGIDFVPRTGLALVHRGEKIVPDPEGPAGSSVATVHTAQGPITIELTLARNEEPLVKLVDARINERALPVVSTRGGQRARLTAGVSRRF